MAMEEVEVTFRYSWIALPPFFIGGFEVFFGGVKVGRRRKFLFPFREVMIAEPGVYEIELRDWQGIFKCESSTKFQVRIPNVERCQIELTLEGSHIGKYFWLIPELKFVQ